MEDAGTHGSPLISQFVPQQHIFLSWGFKDRWGEPADGSSAGSAPTLISPDDAADEVQ